MRSAVTIGYIVWLKILRRKDIYVLFILLGALLLALVSLNVFGLGAVTGYVKDIALVMTWLFSWILAAGLTAKELPHEETRRTIYPLLAKPVTRGELILGKWLGAWTVVSAATVMFYALILAVVWLMGGSLSPAPLLQGIVLHSAAIGMVCAFALLFSTRLHPDAAATLTYVLTGAAYLVVPRVPALAFKETGFRQDALLVLYHVLPHFEIFDMRRRILHDFGPIRFATWSLIVLYAAAVIAALLLLAWACYRRKRFSREGAVG